MWSLPPCVRLDHMTIEFGISHYTMDASDTKQFTERGTNGRWPGKGLSEQTWTSGRDPRTV